MGKKLMKKRKGQWIAVGVMALTSLTLVQNVQAEEQASEVMDGETTIVEDAPRLEALQEGVVEHSIEFENDILEDATTDAKSEVTTLMDESKELLTEVAPLKEQTESTDKSDDINITTDESNIEKIVEPETTQAQPLDAVSTEVDDQTEEDSNKKADVIAVPTKTLGDTKLVPKPVVNPISEVKKHRITYGDTLWSIAKRYNVTLNNLRQWNKITGNLILPNQQIIVGKVAPKSPVEETKPKEETKPTEKNEPTKETKPADQKTTTETKQYTIVRGDTLNKIAAQYGVTVSQLQQWNNISGHLIYPNQTIIVKQITGNNKGDTTVVGGVNQAVQNVMNRYKGQSAYAYFESLTDGQTAGMYQNSLMYGASVPKVVLMAYTQDLIERGLLSWDTKWWYTDAIYNHPESYQWGGSGTIQYENFRSKPYTVREVLHRVGRDSDNLGSNMLLHYVGYRDKADFNRFTQKVYGAPKFSLTVTPKQMTEVVKYMNAQKERQAMTTLDKTIYDGTKLDVLPVNTYQKIGAWWPYYNHTTGIASGDKPFALTVLTNYWSDSKIGGFVKEVYNAFVK